MMNIVVITIIVHQFSVLTATMICGVTKEESTLIYNLKGVDINYATKVEILFNIGELSMPHIYLDNDDIEMPMTFNLYRKKQVWNNGKNPAENIECTTTYSNNKWNLLIFEDLTDITKILIHLDGRHTLIRFYSRPGMTVIILQNNVNFHRTISTPRNQFGSIHFIGGYNVNSARNDAYMSQAEEIAYARGLPEAPKLENIANPDEQAKQAQRDAEALKSKQAPPRPYVSVPPRPHVPVPPRPYVPVPPRPPRPPVPVAPRPQVASNQSENTSPFRRSNYISLLQGEDADNWKSILNRDFKGSDCKAAKDNVDDWRLVLTVPKNIKLFKIRMQGGVNLNYDEVKAEFSFVKNNARQRKIQNDKEEAEEAAEEAEAAKKLASKQSEETKADDKGKGKAKDDTDSSDGSTSSDSSDSSDSSEASMTVSEKDLQEAIKMSLQGEENVKAPETIAEPASKQHIAKQAEVTSATGVAATAPQENPIEPTAPETIAEPSKQQVANEADVTSQTETGVSATAPQENPIEATGDNNVNTNVLHAVLTKAWKSITAIVVAAVTVMFGSFMGRGGQ